jgi:hypothetical protein
MVDAIKSVDPQALVTMDMFTLGAVRRTGPAGMPVYCQSNCAGEYRYPPWGALTAPSSSLPLDASP